MCRQLRCHSALCYKAPCSLVLAMESHGGAGVCVLRTLLVGVFVRRVCKTQLRHTSPYIYIYIYIYMYICIYVYMYICIAASGARAVTGRPMHV
jgi:hypothetical protein